MKSRIRAQSRNRSELELLHSVLLLIHHSGDLSDREVGRKSEEEASSLRRRQLVDGRREFGPKRQLGVVVRADLGQLCRIDQLLDRSADPPPPINESSPGDCENPDTESSLERGIELADPGEDLSEDLGRDLFDIVNVGELPHEKRIDLRVEPGEYCAKCLAVS